MDLKAARNIWMLIIAGVLSTPFASAQLFTDFQSIHGDLGEYQPLSQHQVNALNDNPLLEAYDVKFYGLDVEADNQSDHIQGSVTILLEVLEDQFSILVFELISSLKVDSVLIWGEQHSFSQQDDELHISLNTPWGKGMVISAQVFYGGQTGEGMQMEVDDEWNVPVTYTSSEPFGSKDWFPCKENLADKADSVHVFVTTDYALMAVSQGIFTGTTYFPNGKVRYEWKSNYPIAYYLISIAIADYLEYSLESQPPGSSEAFLIQNFVYDTPGCLDQYREQINGTLAIMDVFCELFGPYPFRQEKYGHYLWPRGGGMEHQTMTGMGNFEFYLVAHELGHSWFGNYLTCATWQDIWVNEGFATYAGYLATEHLGPEYAEGERQYRFERALREPEGSVYIPIEEAENSNRIFSGNLSYNKGMAIIHMIRFELQDDDLFFETLRSFIDIYADSVATGLDFKAVLEETSGLDFTDFFNQWYFGAGFPYYQVFWEQQDGMLTLHSNQTPSSDSNPLFKMSMEYMIHYPGGDTLVRMFQEKSKETWLIPMQHQVEGVTVDPRNQVLKLITGQQNEAMLKETALPYIIGPNPNKGVFTFKSTVPQEKDVKVDIYNITGKLIYTGRFEACMPYLEYRIEPDGLTSGICIVRFSSDSGEEIYKILVE